MSDKPLSPKQERFVDEYLIDLNAKQAAIRAGYAPGSAHVTGARLLTNAKVKAAIDERRAKLAQKLDISAQRVLEELARIGFANISDYIRTTEQGDAFVDLSELTREQAAAISEITVEDFTEGRGGDSRDIRRVKFKLHDKRSALVDIGKHLGMFKERVEHTGADGGPIQTQDVSQDAVREEIAALFAEPSSQQAGGKGVVH